jgi:hypothetical protein
MSIYQNKFVLFIDILGWGKLITDTSDATEEHEHLLSILKQIKEISDFQSDASDVINTIQANSNFDLGSASVKSIHFSDSIVFSFSPTSASFTQVFGMVSGLSSILAKYGYFIRGGLDFGKIHHEGDVIFGPALNQSYKLESEDATYPRIILSNESLDKIETISIPDTFLFKDTDYYCLNNLSTISEVNDVLDIIKFNCTKFKHQNRVLEKYKWLEVKVRELL